MDRFTLASNLIESLAWPLAVTVMVIFLVIFLKKPITQLIARVTKLSYKDAAIDLAPLHQLGDEKVAPKEIDDRTDDAIQNDPRAAVIEAWLRLEWEAKKVLQNLEISGESSSPMGVIRILGKHSLLRGNLYELFKELRRVRNLAAHELNLVIGRDDARQYVELTEQAIARLWANTEERSVKDS